MLQSAKGVQAAKVIVDTGGPNCFWIASAKAFSQVSQAVNGKLYAGVSDIAAALKMDMQALWVIPSLQHGITHLRKLGAKVGAVRHVRSVKEIESMVPFDGSVLMIAVNFERGGKTLGHAIYAYRDHFMRIRYMDRAVNKAEHAVYHSLQALELRYRAINLRPTEAGVIHNIFVKTVLHEIPRLVMPLLGVMATEQGSKR